MHAIQSKQASMGSGCTVGKPEVIRSPQFNFCVARDSSTTTRCPVGGINLFEFSPIIVTSMPVAWMHPTSESLLICNALQKRGELPLFLL